MRTTEVAETQDEIEWRTDDMNLAAYLIYNDDSDFVRFDWEGTSCYIVFDRSGELLRQVTEFVGGEARVDPVRYVAVRAQVRTDLKASKS